VSFLKAGAFDAQNLVTVSESKLLRKLGTLSEEELDAVVNAVQNWFGFNPHA
jgi:mRNA interferase MazF